MGSQTLLCKKILYSYLLLYSRPISCYSGSTAARITEDVKLEENLTRCGFQDDLCYGKVVLTVSNTTTADNFTSQGFLKVAKGCGKRLATRRRLHSTLQGSAL